MALTILSKSIVVFATSFAVYGNAAQTEPDTGCSSTVNRNIDDEHQFWGKHGLHMEVMSSLMIAWLIA